MFGCLKLSCHFSKVIKHPSQCKKYSPKEVHFVSFRYPSFASSHTCPGASTKVSQSKGRLKPKQYGRKVTKPGVFTIKGVFTLCFDSCAWPASVFQSVSTICGYLHLCPFRVVYQQK